MEVFGKQVALPKESILRVLGNLASSEEDKKPVSAAFYVEDGCNAACGFCSQKESVAGARGAEQANLETQERILAVVRRDVPNIYLLGGEPSIHPHLRQILVACTRLGFENVGFNTNAVVYRPEVLKHANMLVCSLFSIDPAVVGAKLFPHADVATQAKLGERVIANVRQYAEQCDTDKTVMVVNKVVTGEEGDIRGVFEIIRFCRELGVKLNIAPAIMPDNRPDPRLINNPAWEFLIDYLLKNKDVTVSSAAYLKTIRRFEDFDCTPNAIPAVRQNGDVDIPCPNVDSPQVVNVLEAGGLVDAIRIGRRRFGDFDPSVSCADQCHKACYVEAANLNRQTVVFEAMRKLFRRRFDGAMKGKSYSYADLLLEFCAEDMHDYDGAIAGSFKAVRAKEELLKALITELSDDELGILRDSLSELSERFDDRWQLAPAQVKAVYFAADVVNQVATRPFTPIFQRMRRTLGAPLIADYTGVRAMNRIARYIKIINIELLKRSNVAAA